MPESLSILLVDDNPIDVESVTRALSAVTPRCRLSVVASAAEALSVLETGARCDQGLPGIVLLDLSLPGCNGFQLLERLRNSDKFTKLPVIVFSSSRSERDINAAYRCGANGFVTKPHDFGALIKTMQSIASFWGDVAELPTQ